jgi:hypothetical protein
LTGITWDDGFFRERRLPEIEPQLALSVSLILPVAAETVFRQDWEDIPAKIHWFSGLGAGEQRADHSRRNRKVSHVTLRIDLFYAFEMVATM